MISAHLWLCNLLHAHIRRLNGITWLGIVRVMIADMPLSAHLVAGSRPGSNLGSSSDSQAVVAPVSLRFSVQADTAVVGVVVRACSASPPCRARSDRPEVFETFLHALDAKSQSAPAHERYPAPGAYLRKLEVPCLR